VTVPESASVVVAVVESVPEEVTESLPDTELVTESLFTTEVTDVEGEDTPTTESVVLRPWKPA